MKAALLKIDSYSLAQLLQLPTGTIIDRIQERFDNPGEYEIRVYGAGWETHPGCLIVPTKGKVTVYMRQPGKSTFRIDWGFDR